MPNHKCGRAPRPNTLKALAMGPSKVQIGLARASFRDAEIPSACPTTISSPTCTLVFTAFPNHPPILWPCFHSQQIANGKIAASPRLSPSNFWSSLRLRGSVGSPFVSESECVCVCKPSNYLGFTLCFWPNEVAVNCKVWTAVLLGLLENGNERKRELQKRWEERITTINKNESGVTYNVGKKRLPGHLLGDFYFYFFNARLCSSIFRWLPEY